jgi:hypothetical protein
MAFFEDLKTGRGICLVAWLNQYEGAPHIGLQLLIYESTLYQCGLHIVTKLLALITT